MSCGALTHAIDDFAAEGFDGAIEFRNVAGDQGAERAAVAGEFFASSPPWFFTSSSKALICRLSESCAFRSG